MSNKTESIAWTFIFAAICCVLASVLLAGSNVKLDDLIKVNQELDQQRSVLIAADLADATTSNEEIAAWFKKEEGADEALVKAILINVDGSTYEGDITPKAYVKRPKDHKELRLVYECTKKGEECFILHVTGKGLWGPMHGYLAIKKDINTILGLSFYNHIETPGLGAEITEPWFRDQFKGKQIFSNGEFKGIKVRKAGMSVDSMSEAEQPYHVDGISGATITSDGVTGITKEYLESFLKWLKK